MGIYDRDYYRDESRGFFGPIADRNRVCTTLIAVTVACFIVQLATRQNVAGFGLRQWQDGWFTQAFVLDPDKVLHGQVWRLLTCAFLHDTNTWSHVFFNMLFLWWFGTWVEDIYGSREFLGFYLVSAVISSVVYVVSSEVMGRGNSALGASGAVTAVMVLFACHYPRHTVLLFFVLPVPIWALVAFQILQDVTGLLGGSDEPIAFAAHLGGAAFGFLYYRMQWRVTNWLPSPGAARPAARPAAARGLRVYRDEATAPPEPAPVAAPAGEVDEHLEAKLDAVLEKVARHGQSSLSEDERRILFRASEIYKRRRK